VGRGCLLARLAEARDVSGGHRLPEESPWPGVTGARGEPEGRLLARLAEARGLSGLHQLPEMSRWPEVIGAGGEPEDRPSVRLGEARGLPGLPGGGTSGLGFCVLLSHWSSAGGCPDVLVMVPAVKIIDRDVIRSVSPRPGPAWQRVCDLSVFRAGAGKRIRFVQGQQQ